MCVCCAGNMDRVRTLVFDSLKQRRMALHYMLLSVAATWPQVLSKSGQFWLTAVQWSLLCETAHLQRFEIRVNQIVAVTLICGHCISFTASYAGISIRGLMSAQIWITIHEWMWILLKTTILQTIVLIQMMTFMVNAESIASCTVGQQSTCLNNTNVA